MLKPRYEVTIEDRVIKESTGIITRLNIVQSCLEKANYFSLSVRLPQQRLFQLDNTIEIKIGYKDQDLKKVFKGRITGIDTKGENVVVSGYDSSIKLLNYHTNKIYEHQTAGDIVKDLAEEAGVTTGEVANGISFPVYVIHDGQNVLHHIVKLAEKCGYIAYINNEDKLYFGEPDEERTHEIKYKQNVVEFSVKNKGERITKVKVRGESPSSTRGTDTYHWLSKSGFEEIAGDGETVYCVFDPTIRDRDTAKRVAESYLRILSRQYSGYVKIIGNPDIRPGDKLKFTGFDFIEGLGEALVLEIENIFSFESGYLTLIRWVA